VLADVGGEVAAVLAGGLVVDPRPVDRPVDLLDGSEDGRLDLVVVAAGGAGVGDDGGDPAADPRVIVDPDGFGVVVEQAERVGM